MSGAPRSAYVAFGLRALTVAMKGKTGARVPLADIVDLAQFHTQLIPNDDAAALALVRFVALSDVDARAAGRGLYAFLLEWRDGEVCPDAERTQEVMAGEFPPPASSGVTALPPSYDWQERADLR